MILILAALAGPGPGESRPVALPTATPASTPASTSGSRSVSTQLVVTATVVAACTVSAPDVLAFGNYFGLPLDAAANVLVRCTRDTPYEVALEPSSRTFTTGPGTLRYNLTPTKMTLLGTGLEQTLTVSGYIPGGQDASVGAYTDSVLVTVSY